MTESFLVASIIHQYTEAAAYPPAPPLLYLIASFMFPCLLQDFEATAYNADKDVLYTPTPDQLQTLINKVEKSEVKYEGNPSSFPQTSTTVGHVYVNMVVADKSAAIKKIVMRPAGDGKKLRIDDLTIGASPGPRNLAAAEGEICFKVFYIFCSLQRLILAID